MKELYQIKHFNTLLALYKLVQKNIIEQLAKKNNCIWRTSHSDHEDSALLTNYLSTLAGKPLLDLKEQDAMLEIVNKFYQKIEEEKDRSLVFDNPRINPFLIYLSEEEAEKYAIFLEPVKMIVEDEKKAEPVLSLYYASNFEKKSFKKPSKTVLDLKKEILTLNFHFLIRRAIEKNIKNRYPLFSLPLRERGSTSLWKKTLTKKLNLLNYTENGENRLAKTLEISNEDFTSYKKLKRDTKDYFTDLVESIDLLDTTLTAAEILNQKIELELQLHQHSSMRFKAF